jgi:AmiR/NasT family two-component response regulator
MLRPLAEAERRRVFPDRWGRFPSPRFAAHPIPFPSSVESGTPGRALIVASDPLLRWALGETARRAGFDVVEPPARRLDGCRQWSVSDPAELAVVVVDLEYWPLDAEATRALERGWGDAAVVAMIPDASPDAADALERLGVRLVLVKPFELTGLRSFLEAQTDP